MRDLDTVEVVAVAVLIVGVARDDLAVLGVELGQDLIRSPRRIPCSIDAPSVFVDNAVGVQGARFFKIRCIISPALSGGILSSSIRVSRSRSKDS